MKPSDGLEPSTPSLPSGAALRVSAVVAHRRALRGRATLVRPWIAGAATLWQLEKKLIRLHTPDADEAAYG